MDKIDEIISTAIKHGTMTQEQHDEILLQIQRDGEIDERESAQLSRLFSAVSSGQVTIVDSERAVLEEHRSQSAQAERAAEDEILQTQKTQAQGLAARIEEASRLGVMTQQEHDLILGRIHADGSIDPFERELLSKLFTAIHQGEIRIIQSQEEKGALDRAEKNERKQMLEEALLRDTQRKEYNAGAQPELVETTTAPSVSNGTSFQAANSFKAPPAELTAGGGEPASGSLSEAEEYSIDALLQAAKCRRSNGKSFQLLNDRLLDVNLHGKVWMKTGAMVGYYGIMKFTREGFFEHGVDKLMKKAVTGEGASLTKATGQGNLYLADKSKKISIVSLVGHSLVVSGKNLLAFEETVKWDITVMRQLAAMWAGGLYNVRMSGNGMAALTTHGDPIVLRVTPAEPVMTDVHATVAWSGSLTPQVKTDMALRTLIGRTSGESLQLRFEGDGFVIIQPYEELPGATTKD